LDRTRQQSLEDSLASRILVLDGAMGTMIQQRNLTAADFGGPALEGCNDYLVLSRPDVILDIHGPHRTRRPGVVFGHDQFHDIAEFAAAEPPPSQIAKETFDHIEPRTAGRGEARVEARLARLPLVFVCT